MYQKCLITAIALLISLLQASSASALNVQALRPSTGAVQGYRLLTSESLPQGEWWVGFQFNYDREPLETATTGGTSPRRAGVVDDFVTMDLLTSYGANDWLDLNIDLPINLFHNIAPTLIPNRDKGGGDIGDLMLSAKFQILDANTSKYHWGFAIVPFVTLPTGRESIYFGDASFTGGLILVCDKQWKANRFFANVGTRFRHREETFLNLVVGHEFLYGFGFQRPIWKKHDLDIILEAQGSTTYKRFIVQELTSPLEVSALIKKTWNSKHPVNLHIGGGIGITDGYSTAHVRAIAGLSIALFSRAKVKCDEAPKLIKLREKIHFKTASAEILRRSYPTLNEVVSILQLHPELQNVLIEGHTDSRADDDYNLRLSERRAQSVRDYLVEKDIDPKRLAAVGYGETKPIATNATRSGRALNRRVDLRVIRYDSCILGKRYIDQPKSSPLFERVRERYHEGDSPYFERVTERWYP